ncbi:MAG: c-type cytochrome, partial [Thermoanaerobaculia bacterium]
MRREIAIRGAAWLLAGALALAVADNVRPWRRQQVEFLELERRQLTAELAAARARPDRESAELQAAMIAADEQIAGRMDDVVRLERELGEFRAKLDEAQRRRAALRYRLEQTRYRARRFAEDPAAAGDSPGSGDAEIESLEAEMLETRTEIEGIREFVDNRERRLGDLRSESLAARERWQRHVAPIEKLDERLRELERGAWWRRLPVAGLFHPSIGIREVAPAALAGEQRIDRCVTCHLGAPRAGFEGERWPLAWRSHPRLDLFLGEASPHPYRQFGCTVCHGGEGRATGFQRAGHLPAAKSPSVRPIFPRGLFETGCVSCHGDQGELRGAVVAEAGRRLIQQMGCRSCHRVPRSAAVDMAKVGPALGGIAAKTSPAWAFQWLAAPRAFRPSTWMPHFFDLDAAGRERQVAEIRAIVVYLWESSRVAAFDEPPRGDAAAGRILFESVGCSACHLADAEAARDASYPGYERLHGPNLARTGDKVAASWLYAWLRDPRAYRHDTPMPSLRLSEREAADLTAYLMTLRDPAWEVPEPPPMPAPVRDELVLSYLQRTATVEASHARLADMTERERNIYLGERSLARYGCAGCHRVPGFEDAEAVDGGDLTALGSGALRFLDGGHPGMGGADLVPAAAPPLPDYGLSRSESAALVVNLLGWQAASESRWEGDAPSMLRERSLAAGRAVLDRFGCRGCHRIEPGEAGDGSESEPLGPDLTVEGAKVQSSWLFDYLRDPASVSLRPWHAARMPTFHWTDAELDAVVRYFADRDGVELFTSDPRLSRERELTVGAAVFRTLQCDRCHPGSEGGIPVPQFAPAYELARHRLRPDWVVDWILDPQRWDPETHMPSSFVSASGNEPDASFLVASFGTPLFRTDQERL